MLLVIAALSALQPKSADSLPEIVRGGRAARMDTLLTRAAAYGFSGQVLVMLHDTVVLHRAYGWADRRRGLPLRLDTRLGIASMSKQFAAAAVQILAASGKLGLDDPVSRYLPDVPDDKRSITIRQVMTHTAGLAGGFADDFEDRTLDGIVGRVLERPLRWPPGTRWGYSSEGYALLAAIAARASGESWDQYLERHVFQPAGMQRSGTWRMLWREGDAAHGYLGPRDNGSPASWPLNWRVAGGGDVISTAADLYRWHRSVAANRVFSSHATNTYLSSLVNVDSTTRYGFGLFHWTTPYGAVTIEHGGDTDLGYNGAFSRFPDRGGLLILLTNVRDWFGRSGRSAVQGEIEAMLLGGRPDTVALPPEAVAVLPTDRERVRGTWELGDGSRIHLLDDGSQLWAAGDGQSAVNSLTSRSGEQAARLARATTRTRELLDAVIGGDSLAVTQRIADTSSERIGSILATLARLREKHGVIRDARVLGSIVRPGAVLTTIAVTSARHEQYRLAFRWGGDGLGGLTAVFDGPAFPVIIGVGREPAGSLLPYDMVSGRKGESLRIVGEGRNRRMVLPDGREARFLGFAGWLPN